ncbi:MAG: hypothetical protein JXR70_12895 [Spirochaetales bacterium]|nr:hypothetical protein [Spirochaetales bacterium]
MRKLKLSFILSIVILIVIIYVAFIALDVMSLIDKINGKAVQSKQLHTISEIIKFFITSFCVLLVLGSVGDNLSKMDFLLMKIAFGFTFLADFYLVVLQFMPGGNDTPDMFFTIGAGFFIFAQVIFIFRHTQMLKNYSNRFRKIFYIVIIAGIFIYHGSLALYYLGIKIQTVIAPAIYALYLFTSVGFAWHTRKSNFFPEKNQALIIVGMTLFLCCDLSIAVAKLFSFWGIMIWVFYAPAITLLAISTYDWHKTKVQVPKAA